MLLFALVSFSFIFSSCQKEDLKNKDFYEFYVTTEHPGLEKLSFQLQMPDVSLNSPVIFSNSYGSIVAIARYEKYGENPLGFSSCRYLDRYSSVKINVKFNLFGGEEISYSKNIEYSKNKKNIIYIDIAAVLKNNS